MINIWWVGASESCLSIFVIFDVICLLVVLCRIGEDVMDIHVAAGC